MPAVRRVSGSKKRAIEYGRRIVHLKVGLDRRHFTVHEDLLCNSSPYFRRSLQENRQDMEGECSICHEEMKVGQKELTYCKTCGGNLHYACMENWMELKPSAQQDTCPLCRAVYENNTISRIHTCEELVPTEMAAYIEWLYTRQISVEDEADPENSDIPHPDWYGIFQAYTAGVFIGDRKFAIATLEAILETIEDTGLYPSLPAINYAYQSTRGTCGLRKLLVQTYAGCGGKVRGEHVEWDNFPIQFVKELCTWLMKESTVGDNWDFEALKEMCKNAEENGEHYDF